MTITLNLSLEQEARLKARAVAAGMTDPSEYLISCIDDVPNQMSSAEAINNFLGATKDMPTGYGDPNIDSPELARQLRHKFSNRNHDI